MKFLPTIFLGLFCFSLSAQSIDSDSFKTVNSSFDELQPVLSPDRHLLFFTIANHPANVGGRKDPGDIWYSVSTAGGWSAPMHAGAAVNDRTYNGVAGLSADGSQLFLLNHYTASGETAKTQGIAVSRFDGRRWSKPENISIPYFQNKSGILQGYITPDKGVFVFSAETYGTRGVEDIYVSLNEDGRWTEPKNLGDKINTPFQELSPSLSDDGRTLYFSSNGKKGKGSFDIYSATRLDDTWSNWSDPLNLESINTEGRELYYRPYNDLGLSIFTTTKNSDGYGDINLFRPGKSIAADSVEEKSETLAISDNPALTNSETVHTVRVHGKVTNAKTGEAIEAAITLTRAGFNDHVASGIDGFTVALPGGKNYSVQIQSKGYVSDYENLDVTQIVLDDYEMNIKLQPLAVGTTINLKNVLFERGTSVLLPESDNELNVVVSFLKSNPSVKIELKGHTDNRGVHADNVKLSQERVDKVKQYLVANGIDAKRISGKGYGGLKPIASNDTEETRRLNRRVEFMIKKF